MPVLGGFLGPQDDRWFVRLLEVSGSLFSRFRLDAWLTWELYDAFVEAQLTEIRDRSEDEGLRALFREHPWTMVPR